MKIKVDEVKQSTKNWCYIIAKIDDKIVWLSLNPKLGVSPKASELYDVEFVDKPFIGKDGKPKTGHEITKIALFSSSQPLSQKSSEVSKSAYSEDDKKAFRAKDEIMRRSVAMKCSCQLTEANAMVIAASDLAKTMSKENIREWLDSIRKNSFNNFLNEIEDEIPF